MFWFENKIPHRLGPQLVVLFSKIVKTIRKQGLEGGRGPSGGNGVAY